MKTQYKTVDTSTLEGLKQAERLKAQGWTVGSVGFFRVQFYRKHVPKGAALAALKAHQELTLRNWNVKKR